MEAPAVVTLHDAAAEQELAMKHDHAEAAPELDAEFDALAWPAMRRLVAFWSRRGSVAIGLLWLCVLGVGAWSFPNVLAKFKNDVRARARARTRARKRHQPMAACAVPGASCCARG